ncbi:MAG: oligopeptide transporter, OPT family [Verrucomicrobiales bacterium]|nr:oligopeptide transporter, OPT family [Verrucomicrobiales bacterium]
MASTSNTGSDSIPGGDFQPYIPAQTAMREFTLRAVVIGALLGMVFGASSLYLVLKVGLTVSASIPVAVISLALFRMWSKFGGRDATILENNIVQTAGSAGESIAFGLGVTMPAIMILGFDLEITRVMLVGVLGGLLGILMMIPLRRALIVAQHGQLKYPEGTACAQVLKAGANAESRAAASVVAQAEAEAAAKRGAVAGVSAKTIFTGFGVGLAYKAMMSAFKLWKDTPEKIFGPPLKAGSISAEISPELLGVGYIIGPRISCIMMAGGALSFLLLIPLIRFFGEGMTDPVAPGTIPIGRMSPGDIHGTYILYIGAGAVAAGGIISLLRSLPTIWHGLRAGLVDLRKAAVAHTQVSRTDRDLPMSFVSGGVVALVLAILFARPLHMNLLGAILIVIFGFLFVTVSSRLTGEIGSSSNPISGMTVATLLLTCLIFLIVGWTGGGYYVTALSVGGIVCIAASNGGTTSQDLKTGFLIGGTPRFQQIAILVGATASALVLGPILLELNSAGTAYLPVAKVAPGLHAPADAEFAGSATIPARHAVTIQDTNTYRVWQKLDDAGGRQGKYLVDDSGAAVWYIDPGINPAFKGEAGVGGGRTIFEAPKAMLMSYIIKGILDAKLPWALVLFGVMISLVMELCGVSSLAFAVGVYLPISSSAPIFVGGLIRWLVDWRMRHQLREHDLDEATLAAESDKSPGVLLASGYIAGGAIAGIVIAFIAGALPTVDGDITDWARTSNPLFAGPHADWLSLLPFVALTLFLYLVGREVLLRNTPGRDGGSEAS